MEIGQRVKDVVPNFYIDSEKHLLHITFIVCSFALFISVSITCATHFSSSWKEADLNIPEIGELFCKNFASFF